MTTARILIKKAMQKIGAITKNESPSADEVSDGLDALNDLLESWSTESLHCFVRAKESFPLTSAPDYNIGPGQTFDTDAPINIIAATIRWDNADYPLGIVAQEQYEQDATIKTTQGLPRFLTYDNGFPVGKISLYPAPGSAYILRLLSEKRLSRFELNDEVILPAGWMRALIYNLAVEMRPEYGGEDDGDLDVIAARAKGNIARAVARARPMDSYPSMSRGTPNVYNGYMS